MLLDHAVVAVRQRYSGSWAGSYDIALTMSQSRRYHVRIARPLDLRGGQREIDAGRKRRCRCRHLSERIE